MSPWAVKVEIRFEDETFWLTQKKLTELSSGSANHQLPPLRKFLRAGNWGFNYSKNSNSSTKREVSREVDFTTWCYHCRGLRANSYQATNSDMDDQCVERVPIKGFVLMTKGLSKVSALTKITLMNCSNGSGHTCFRTAVLPKDHRPLCRSKHWLRFQSAGHPAFYKTVQNKLHWRSPGRRR